MINNRENIKIILFANTNLDSTPPLNQGTHLDERLINATRQALDVLNSNSSFPLDAEFEKEANFFVDKVVSLLDHSTSPYSDCLKKIFWGPDISSAPWEVFVSKSYFFLDRIEDIESIINENSDDKEMIYQALTLFITDGMTADEIADILETIEIIPEDEIEIVCKRSLKFVKRGMVSEDIVSIIATVNAMSEEYGDLFFELADEFINNEIFTSGRLIKEEMNGDDISFLLEVIADLPDIDDPSKILDCSTLFIKESKILITEEITVEEIANIIKTVSKIVLEDKEELLSISIKFMKEMKERHHIIQMNDSIGVLEGLRNSYSIENIRSFQDKQRSSQNIERILGHTDELLSLTKTGINAGDIITAIGNLSEEDFRNLFDQSISLIREGMSGEEVANILEAIRWILHTTDEEHLLKAKEWISDPFWISTESPLSGSEIAYVLEKIVRVTEDERRDVIEILEPFILDVETLFEKKISPNEKADLLEVIGKISLEQREGILNITSRFIRDIIREHTSRYIDDLASMLEMIHAIDSERRERSFNATTQFIEEEMTGLDISHLLEAIDLIPNDEISSVLEETKKIINHGSSAETISSTLIAILTIPLSEREHTCFLVNQVSDAIDLNAKNKYVLLESIRKFPLEERENILLSFKQIIEDNISLSLNEFPDILELIAKLPFEERWQICTFAKLLTNQLEKKEEVIHILKTLSNYPNEEREHVSFLVNKFLLDLNVKYIYSPHVLFFLQNIPPEERENVFQLATLLWKEQFSDLDFRKEDLTSFEIVDFLEQVRFIHTINTLRRENLSQMEINDIFKIFSTIAPRIKQKEFYDKIRSALSRNIEKEDIPQIILTHQYAQVLKCNSENAMQTIRLIKKFLKADDSLEAIINFIEKNKPVIEKAKKSIKALKIQQKYYPELPRSLQANPDGSLYLLLNKTQKGDPLIGTGSYKRVKGAINLQTGEFVARSTQKKTLKAEKELLLSLQISDHEGIAKTYASTKYKTAIDMETGKIAVMQKFYNGGDLLHVLTLREDRSLALDEKFLVAKKLLSALSFMHEQQIIHRDLKLDNLFVECDPDTQKITDVVIGDFGFACRISDEDERWRHCGTRPYISPELSKEILQQHLKSQRREQIISANHYPNDNWAAGVILYILFKKDIAEWKTLSDSPFWFDLDRRSMLDQLSKLKEDWLPVVADPNSIGQIIRALLNPNPAKRMVAAEALARLRSLLRLV